LTLIERCTFNNSNLRLAVLKLLLFLEKSTRGGGCAVSNYPFVTQKERDIKTGLITSMLAITRRRKGDSQALIHLEEVVLSVCRNHGTSTRIASIGLSYSRTPVVRSG